MAEKSYTGKIGNAGPQVVKSVPRTRRARAPLRRATT